MMLYRLPPQLSQTRWNSSTYYKKVMLIIKDIVGDDVINITDPIAVSNEHNKLQYLWHAIKYRANHTNVSAIDQNNDSEVESDDPIKSDGVVEPDDVIENSSKIIVNEIENVSDGVELEGVDISDLFPTAYQLVEFDRCLGLFC